MKSISKISRKLSKALNLRNMDTSLLFTTLLLFILSLLIHYRIYIMNSDRDETILYQNDTITDRAIDIDEKTNKISENTDEIKVN